MISRFIEEKGIIPKRDKNKVIYSGWGRDLYPQIFYDGISLNEKQTGLLSVSGKVRGESNES